MKIKRSYAALAGVLLAGGIYAGSAYAGDDATSTANCTVSGDVTITPGIPAEPATVSGPDGFTFTSVSITCSGAPGDDASPTGSAWTVNASGNDSTGLNGGGESCAGGQGDGTFTGGTSPNNADGNVTGGSFHFTRVGTQVTIQNGTLVTANGETHSFSAELSFTPNNGGCIAQPGNTTSAGITGSAVVSE